MRSSAVRSISRPLVLYNGGVAARPRLTGTIFKSPLKTSTRAGKTPQLLSLALRKPLKTSLIRFQTTSNYDKKVEEGYQREVIQPDPGSVSSGSSVRHLNKEVGVSNEPDEVDMMAGIKSDFKTIKDTFTLDEVPREALYVGLAGVVPYLGTSLCTVYLSWDIQHAAHHGEGFLLSGETAEKLLHVLEPIQLGYGATIISFLGAIHWGLEWAGFGGHQGYPRYAIGIVATAVAWPTLLLSAEVGLIAQFLAFTFLYYADARASTRGWAPSWYSTYRFVLTFIVGASIVASLIGRGQIADLVTKPPGPADRMRALRATQMEQLEKEEIEKSREAVDEEEEQEE